MSKSNKITSWMKPYPELAMEGDKIFCRACSKLVSTERKSLVDQHTKTPSHIAKCERWKRTNSSQQTMAQCLTTSSKKSEQEEFNKELCKVLISCNIPLTKVNNVNLKLFLQRFCKQNVPDESTLRKNYVNSCYNETMSEIRQLVGSNCTYIIVDESTDKCVRYIAHLLIGILHEDILGKSYLIASKQLQKTNNLTITRFVQEGVSSLKDIHVSVPMAVQRGQRAILQCHYDLEGEPLYTLKWYKNDREFFRYAPKESPPLKYFPLADHNLLEKYSNGTQIVFDNVSMKVAGDYCCEISLDEPSFYTGEESASLKVVEIPRSDPIITGLKTRYRRGDVIKADCISKDSQPAANLTWFVNDQAVHPSHIKIHRSHMSNNENGLVSARLGLRLLINEQLFARERLKIRCVASMYNVYYRSSEKSIELEKKRPRVYTTTTTTELPWEMEPPPERYPQTTCSAELTEVRCIESGRFYRDPDAAARSRDECSKYFLCLEGEVFEFRCSSSLLFDVSRQICDLEENVRNCNVSSGAEIASYSTTNSASNVKDSVSSQLPPPVTNEDNCQGKDEVSCEDGECLPLDYVCDGYEDCADGSDEASCGPYNDPNAAAPCNSTICQLPDCFCSTDGTAIPGNLDVTDVPQMILLTFEDAITYENYNIVSEVFKEHRRNQDGCPIRGTFFISHYNNNYHLTQKLWNDGHEIAVHSVTNSKDWWSYNATVENWFDEMVGEANIIHKYAKVRMDDIRGLRVPFLQVGWNRQFLMMKEFGFVYDSSIVAPFQEKPLWPYTLDFAIPHNCEGNKGNCPSRPFSGIWELVLNPLKVEQSVCALLHSCPETVDEDEFYTALIYNFKRHYNSNRAPFGLYLQASWVRRRGLVTILQKFLDEVLRLPNVWFVTASHAIKWMRHPIPVSELANSELWTCRKQLDPTEIVCNNPNVCILYSYIINKQKSLYTCSQCPKIYPWFRNEFGID